jgi:glyoxylase-like metal-dependent hydrolase (beta-lactamase superfamily II)
VHVRRLTLGPFQSNCFLVATAPGEEALVIDPGDEAGVIADSLTEWASEPVAILLTHAHMDHIGAVAGLKQRFDVPVYLHADDQPLYEHAEAQAAAFGMAVEPPPPVDHDLAHGQELRLADLTFEVRHAPGHSPGGVVFVAEGHAFVGDCVFAGSIGRTDLPGGDMATLLRSINEQILTLPETTVLHTGHGPETTVGREAAANPFLTGAFGWSL